MLSSYFSFPCFSNSTIPIAVNCLEIDANSKMDLNKNRFRPTLSPCVFAGLTYKNKVNPACSNRSAGRAFEVATTLLSASYIPLNVCRLLYCLL